jgi:hypothetical protein
MIFQLLSLQIEVCHERFMGINPTMLTFLQYITLKKYLQFEEHL